MPKPVTTVIRRQPIGPKPTWQGLFREPEYLSEVNLDMDSEEASEDDENCLT